MANFTLAFLRGSNRLKYFLAVFCAPCDVYALCLATKSLHRVSGSVCLSTRLLGASLRVSLGATLRSKGVVSLEALAAVFSGNAFAIAGSTVLQAVFGEEDWGGGVDCYIGNANSETSLELGRKMATIGFDQLMNHTSSASSNLLPGMFVLRYQNSHGYTVDIYRDPARSGMEKCYTTPLHMLEQFDIEVTLTLALTLNLTLTPNP